MSQLDAAPATADAESESRARLVRELHLKIEKKDQENFVRALRIGEELLEEHKKWPVCRPLSPPAPSGSVRGECRLVGPYYSTARRFRERARPADRGTPEARDQAARWGNAKLRPSPEPPP
jgi:hypothetical protein